MDIKFEDAKAHVDEESGRSQSLKEHLFNVAKLSSEYAAFFKCAVSGYYAGLYHDMGKWSEAFEKRLEGGKSVDHSSLGAYLMFCRKHLAEAIVIAAHHSGLLDMDLGRGSSSTSTFRSRMLKMKDSVDLTQYLDVLAEPDVRLPVRALLDLNGLERCRRYCLLHARSSIRTALRPAS